LKGADQEGVSKAFEMRSEPISPNSTWVVVWVCGLGGGGGGGGGLLLGGWGLFRRKKNGGSRG